MDRLYSGGMGTTVGQTRYKGIDAARGFAAISVLVAHSIEIGSLSLFKEVSKYVSLGAGGVYLFFMISGFVIPFSLRRVKSVKDFAIGRVFRMYPLFLASLAVAVMAVLVGASPWMSSKPFVLSALLNLTMIQEFLGFPSLRGAYWTLGYEFIFYLLLGGLFAAKRTAHLWKLSPLLSMALLALSSVTWITSKSIGGDRLVGFAFMFLGCAFFSFRMNEITKKQITGITLLAVFAISFQWMTSISLNSKSLASASNFPTMLISICGFLWALSIADTKVNPKLVYLGVISYSIYLVHGMVLIWLRPEGMFTGTFLFVAVVSGVTILISAATYKFIEQPGIKLGRRLLGKD